MTKRNGKRALIVVLALMVMMAFGSISFGTAYYGNEHYKQSGNLYNKTWFSPGHKTDGKWAENCWSRIVEGSDVSYKKSTTLLASKAKSTSTPKQQALASQSNNPLKSQTYSYGFNFL